jgi:hypothetical protein
MQRAEVEASAASGHLSSALQGDLLSGLGSVCALPACRSPASWWSASFLPPCSQATLVAAERALGLRIRQMRPEGAAASEVCAIATA